MKAVALTAPTCLALTSMTTLTYQSTAIQATGASFVRQSNTFGGQSSAYPSDMALGTTPPLAMASFHFAPKNCSGFRCTALNPLTQN